MCAPALAAVDNVQDQRIQNRLTGSMAGRQYIRCRVCPQLGYGSRGISREYRNSSVPKQDSSAKATSRLRGLNSRPRRRRFLKLVLVPSLASLYERVSWSPQVDDAFLHGRAVWQSRRGKRKTKTCCSAAQHLDSSAACSETDLLLLLAQ